MNHWNSDIHADVSARRNAFDRINASGTDVKEPASRIPYILGGGLLGYQAARYMGAGWLGKAVGALAGARIGNGVYNSVAGDAGSSIVGPGLVNRGW